MFVNTGFDSKMSKLDESNEPASNCYCGKYLFTIIKLPWIKCKTFYRKIVNRNTTKSKANDKRKYSLLINQMIIDNNNQNIDNLSSKTIIFTMNNNNNGGYNDDTNCENLLLIKCPNCHRKSVIESMMTNNRYSSLWQLSTTNDRMKQIVSSSSKSAMNLFTCGAGNNFRSQPNTPACMPEENPRGKLQTKTPSPSNYCRVATCEKLHIHDITPKCLETFAPSSTCSSCQYCDRKHIGPNHDQLLMVKQLVKELPLSPTTIIPVTDTVIVDGQTIENQKPEITTGLTSSLLMQWPLPEYRPQNSPDHLYRRFEF